MVIFPGTIVHIPTLEDYIEVVNYCLCDLGLIWHNDSCNCDKHRYYRYKKETCIRVDTHIHMAPYYFYKRCGNRILTVDEFYINYSKWKILLKEFK